MPIIDSREWPVVLQQMESKMLAHYPEPLRKEFDAEGMDRMLYQDQRSQGFPGGGMGGLQYAMDWVEESPEAMFEWLVKKDGRCSYYAHLLFIRWASKDMEEVLAAVFKIPDSELRAQALISSLEVLCESNPGRARELLMQNLGLFPPGEDTPVFNGSGDFLNLISSLPLGSERTHLLAGLLYNMEDSTEAVDFWKGLPESGRRDLVVAGFSPYETYSASFEGLDNIMRERAESTGDTELAVKFVECHGEAWAKRDLTGALDWAHVHLKGMARAKYRGEFFQTGIKENFDEAIRVWKALPDGYVKADVAEAMLRVVPDDRKAEAEAVLKPPKKE